MLEKIKKDGRKLVTIIDPHTKVDPEYWMYRDTKEMGLNVKMPNGEEFESECWPKESVWLDFLNRDTRDYLKKLYCNVPKDHSDPDSYIWNDKSVYIWNDMNEPACFNQNESTFSKSSIHKLNSIDDPDSYP